MQKWNKDMPDFSCDVDVYSALTLCGAIEVFAANEQNLKDLCFNMLS